MYAVGMLGSYISQGVYTVAAPFHPFGGAVDIIVVQQEDGTFKTSPWYVKFGKFQGVLKRKEKIVDIAVNDVQANFHMYLDHKGEAYFEKEVESDNEDTMLSPPSAPSSGDEMVEYQRRKRIGCTSESVRVHEGLEMQESRKTEAAAGVPDDGDNPDSAMTNGRNSEQVDSDPTVWVSGALVNQGRSEVVIAISETGGYLVDGNCLGTVNGSKAILEREDERLGTAVSKPSRSIFGLVFGRNAQHVPGGPSSMGNGGKQIVVDDFNRLSLVDLIDRRWVTGGNDTSLSPANRVQIAASSSSSSSSSSSASESATQAGSEGPQSTEKGSLMHGSESSVVGVDEASSRQPEHQGYSVQEVSVVDSERSGQEDMNREKTSSEDLEVSILRLETPNQNRENTEANVVEEDWFLQTSVEEETLYLLFQGSLGDGSSPEAARPATEEASGTLVEDVNSDTTGTPDSEVVLMSVDGHIMTAPVNSETDQSMQVEVDTINSPGRTLVDISGQSARVGETSTGLVESTSQQGLESFYSLRRGSYADLEAENGEEDIFKSCLALEDLSHDPVIDNVKASCDSGFEAVSMEKVLLSSDNVELGASSTDGIRDQQPSANRDDMPSPSRDRSKPIAIPQDDKEKRAVMTSSGSLPTSFYKAEKSGYGHSYSHSVDSSPLPSTPMLHLEAEARKGMVSDGSVSLRTEETRISGEGFDGNLSMVDRQTMEAIIFGNGRDATEFAEVLGVGKSSSTGVDISLCRHLLSEGMGAEAAAKAFTSQKVSFEEFKRSGSAIVADDKLVVKIGERYFPWVEAAPYILGMVAFGTGVTYEMQGGIAVEAIDSAEGAKNETGALVPSPGGWSLWPFRRSRVEKGALSSSSVSDKALLAASKAAVQSPFTEELLQKNGYYRWPRKSKERTYVPTSMQLASLKLKEGPNKVTFTFSTRMLGKQQVDAQIYLWSWNTRIVISDVDGTITKSDVLGQVMPLVGRDWSQSGVTRLFSAIKDNGYEVLFLSARAISQAYLTRQFLLNLKQDGETLPNGPVVISPDGLFPSLYREVIRRAPHEFKISCLEGIRELFPPDVNPFYAGFGNRETDEISYLKVGIPKGKIFIINPKGEVAVNHRVDVKSYTSLHTLVGDMFPAMSSREQEDFNSWNYWKLPLPDIDDDLSENSLRSTKKGGDSKR